MAAFDYEEARSDALDIIEEFGDTLNIIKKGLTGGRDAFRNPIPDTPDVVITGKCSPLLDYDSSMQGQYEAKGSEIIVGDKYCFYHAESAEPEIGMHLTSKGTLYRVQSIVDLTSLGGVRVLTKLQLRG